MSATNGPTQRRSARSRRPTVFGGVMSGTSLDGVDAVLADFTGASPRLIEHLYVGYPEDLRSQLRALCASGPDEIERSGRTGRRLADLYADCINRLLANAGMNKGDVAAIGVHGQTIRHRPEAGYSVQLNAPARIAELTGIDVVADFRSRDLAAGGHGAPLVPAFHALAFAGERPRAVVNIGGISNISYLTTPAPLGFDCGPGNLLLDAWTRRHWDEPFDRDGRLAAEGQADQPLLTALLTEPFLRAAPPKSTGRELFSVEWLDRHLVDRDLPPADVQATLVELTARSISDAIDHWCDAAEDLVVCGGGARNRSILAALERLAAPRGVRRSDEFGIDPEQVEAMAFAWLARACSVREPGNLPSVTGAAGPRVLGALYPA